MADEHGAGADSKRACIFCLPAGFERPAQDAELVDAGRLMGVPCLERLCGLVPGPCLLAAYACSVS